MKTSAFTWLSNKRFEATCEIPERMFFASQQLGDDQHRFDIKIDVRSISARGIKIPLGKMTIRIDGAKRTDGSGEKWSFDGFLMAPRHKGVKVQGKMITKTGWMTDIVILQRKWCDSLDSAVAHPECREHRWLLPDDMFCPKCGKNLHVMEAPTITL
jgi:hypothetical protein